MDGYVKNKTHLWRHAMKREIGPGAAVELDELYKQYGEKHSLEKGSSFVDWLRHVKLRDNNVWQIVYNEGNNDKIVDEKSDVDSELPKTDKMVSPHVKKGVSAEQIADFSVRQAREKLSKITDISALKYALSSANKLSGKDTLCNMIRKRISELQIIKR